MRPSSTYATMDHKHNLAFRPLETALLTGKVDAIYTHSKTWQHLQEDTGKIAAIEDLSRYPDWTSSGEQPARRHHLHRRHG